MYIKISKEFLMVLAFVIIVAGVLINQGSDKSVTYPNVVTTEAEFERMVYDSVTKYKNEIKFKTTLYLDTYDFDGLFRKIMDQNTYVGSELYEFRYHYTYGSDGVINAKLHFECPKKYRVKLTQIRTKQIAGDLEGLSRYDQIKAVHDYLVINNEYSYMLGGSFHALYMGKSSCNGYAFSFYAIMEELGIPATVEYGGSHAWNLVELDGEWYNVDCTWDDQGGKNIGYQYFLKSNYDFPGHEHYSATAAESYDMSNAGSSMHYLDIPPYNAFLILSGIIAVILFIAAVVMLFKMKAKREQRERLEAMAAPVRVESLSDDADFEEWERNHPTDGW